MRVVMKLAGSCTRNEGVGADRSLGVILQPGRAGPEPSEQSKWSDWKTSLQFGIYGGLWYRESQT